MSVPASSVGFPSDTRIQKELVENSKTEKIPKTHKKNHKTKKTTKKTSKTIKSNMNSLLTIFSANAAGMAKKSHSLTHELKECNATIFSIQETNYKKKGRYVNNEYEIF